MGIMLKSIIYDEERVKRCHGKAIIAAEATLAGMHVNAKDSHSKTLKIERYTYVPGSKLPLFPYNRGWSSTQ